MAEKIKIGNRYVAPLTYEIIKRAEDASARAAEAMQKENWDIANMAPEELLRKLKKYYRAQLAEE